MRPTGNSEPPLVYRTLDEVPQEAAHRSYVCAFSLRRRPWCCDGCGAEQEQGTWRYWHHFPEMCRRKGLSRCYAGPFCPHCAEAPMVPDWPERPDAIDWMRDGDTRHYHDD